MALGDMLVTMGVLLGLFILAYCRFTGKSLSDMISEVRDSFGGEVEEIDIR